VQHPVLLPAETHHTQIVAQAKHTELYFETRLQISLRQATILQLDLNLRRKGPVFPFRYVCIAADYVRDRSVHLLLYTTALFTYRCTRLLCSPTAVRDRSVHLLLYTTALFTYRCT